MLMDESSLPRHVLVNSVLAYLDLYSLIKFSCASRACRDVVFLDVPKSRWREIDVSGNLRITDEQLRVFLENIDPRGNTRVLSLAGCVNVKGMGLDPLRGSTVMEDIDLHVLGSLPLLGESGKLFGPSGLSEDCVAGILQSMLPPLFSGRHFPLRRVAIQPRSTTLSHTARDANYGPAIGGFLLHHDSLRRSLPPSDPWNCDGPDPCSLCCVAGAVFCDSCDGRFCDACAMPQDCPESAKRKCQWCSTIVACAACGRRRCASHGFEGCGGCEAIYCRECHVDELDFSIVRNEYYCQGCAPPYWGGNIR
jgi:hypothetical protein